MTEKINFPWQIISFEENGRQLGILKDNKIVNLSAAWLEEHKYALSGFTQLFNSCDSFEAACEWIEQVWQNGNKKIKLSDVKLYSPVNDPKMFYDFLGFEKHVKQVRERRGTTVPEIWYKRPAYYIGSIAPKKTFGPNSLVTVPSFVEKADYEFEIALVVGRDARLMDEASAWDFIRKYCFFTILNDWSARDYQKFDMELGISVAHSKSLIGNSIGPALVHASSFDYDARGLPNIGMRLIVNDECRCQSNYNTVYWDFAKILTFLGRDGIGVCVGDILGSGTVGDGCIAEFAARVDEDGNVIDPAKYKWLSDGDTVELSVEGIGQLINRVSIVELPGYTHN